MKSLLAATFIVCLAILGLNIYWHYQSPGVSPDHDPRKKVKDSAIQMKFAANKVDFNRVSELTEKLRDTLDKTFGKEYGNLHTGGVKFTYDELDAFLDDMKDSARKYKMNLSEMNVYVCPGLYPLGTTSPGGRLQEFRMTSLLVVPKNSKPIFDAATRKLTMTEPELLGAFNWGDLEP